MPRLVRPGFARQFGVALAAIVLAAGAASPAGPAKASPSPSLSSGTPYVEGEILVKFRAESPAAVRRAVRLDVAGETTRRFASGAELWRLGAGVAVPDAIERLKTAAGVEYAEPNYLLHATATPDDLFFPQQWSLVNTGQDGGTAGADIDAGGAWDISTGGASVVVAVIDSGIDLDHPDLAPNIWTNPDPGEVMTFKPLDTVVLRRDLRAHGLKAGDMGAVVEVYPPDGLEVEFVLASGRTKALLTLKVTDVRPIRGSDLPAFRSAGDRP